MLDFMKISVRKAKNNVVEIYPSFVIKTSSDLMTRGGDFYAVWNAETNFWSAIEDDAIELIDKELDIYRDTIKSYAEKIYSHKAMFDDIPSDLKSSVEIILNNSDASIRVLHMRDADSGMIDKWHKYVQKQRRESFHPLDEKLIFLNTETVKEDYASKCLPYSLEETTIESYEEMISTLYSSEERRKIEWAIGAIISGDSKSIQKFIVMYGPPGSGKSTILNIMEQLFTGYYSTFDSKALGSSNNAFALEAFRGNPLVAIQHDGDLSRIEDNTRLNSLVSHELMTVNEKFKAAYSTRFNAFLFMGTNKPVRITDAKSGILRRLIDVSPSGEKIPQERYFELMHKIKFELGGIAMHCLNAYKSDPNAYDNYIPTSMLGASNDFYNFIIYYYDDFISKDYITLQTAWEMYNKYCQFANVTRTIPYRSFSEELKSYYKEYHLRYTLEDGTRLRSCYMGFDADKFDIYSDTFQDMNRTVTPALEKETSQNDILFPMECNSSIFDEYCQDCPAQYAELLSNGDDKPEAAWANVRTTLKDINTTKLHYVRVPIEHIVIDFDLKDENGEKSFELNAQAAAKWPSTYAELSKSGKGIHLHYIYTGDPTKLSCLYEPDIEIKVFTGLSSLRRKFTKSNGVPIAKISTGLPLKKEDKVVNFEGLANEKALRTMILRNLNKEYGSTKVSINYIFNALEDAYKSGMKYDVSDLRKAITTFAGRSTNNANYCLKLVQQMHYHSDEMPVSMEKYESDTLIFFDCEVFPNLFLICWKAAGPDRTVIKMFNPSPKEVEDLGRFKLIGFNNRGYDNHICCGRILGDSIAEVFDRSFRIINKKDREAKLSMAYNWSYTDIFDFVTKKQSLKKYEIELGEPHLECEYPWDKDLPEECWDTVAKYCANDVRATEAVWNSRHDDFVARQILADLAGMTVNDTTNSLTTHLIVGNNKKPQAMFQYRDLSQPVTKLEPEMDIFLRENFPEMMSEPHIDDGVTESLLPYFPGYSYDMSKKMSTYKGVVVGEGGRVWAKPGMYSNVITFDVASMHPHSIISEYLFGPYTVNYNNLKNARIAIKHKDFDKVKTMFDGRLNKYLDDPGMAKNLSTALKLPLNSTYGITDASFDNPLRDPRNIDNIVAKRGALFMVDLQEEVEKRGGEVIHIKTDSIKVVDPTPELQEFILWYGKRHGYTFEIEHKFEKICLVNNAVYIAKVSLDDEEWLDDCRKAEAKGKPKPTRWTATGAQFAQPYVFKYLFSKEPLEFSDMCETKEVKAGTLYLDLNEELEPDQHNYHFIGKVGEFCPIKKGCGGGDLLSLNDKTGTFGAATGTKGFHWLETEMVKTLKKQDCIDEEYYRKLVDEAKNDISQFGNFEWFVSE